MHRAWLGTVLALAVTGCGGVQPGVVQRDAAADAQLSQSIRKAIMADVQMSPDARNLYIETQNGLVTLRGAVNSAEERNSISKIARQAHGADGIIDEMQILPTAVLERFAADSAKAVCKSGASVK